MISTYTWNVVLEEWEESINQKKLVEREIAPKIIRNLENRRIADVILGVRRAGKSSLMQSIYKKLDNAVYVNFEDERLTGATFKDLTVLEKITKAEYYFLDEVQNVKGWEKWVRRIVDTEKAKVIISASNSTLLSKEYGSLLTGRKITHYLSTFTLAEARKVKNLTLEEYLRTGGFPEVIISGLDLAKEYREDIFYRDLVTRNIAKSSALKRIYNYLLDNPSSLLSLKRLKNLAEISYQTLHEYLKLIADTFVVFFIKKFSFSSMEAEKSPVKNYVVDNGLVIKEQNLGVLLENVVAQHLYAYSLNNKKTLYYIRETKNIKYEVDFYLDKTAIQVAYEVNEENIKREIKGLLNVKAKKKLLAVHVGAEYIDVPKGIEIVPVEKLLQKIEKWGEFKVNF